MNWGARIALIYTGFVLMILSLVFMSMRQKVELEEENYYEKEIQYENRINAKRNVSQLQEKLLLEINSSSIQIIFPKEIRTDLEGNIILFRPSDKSLDRIFHISCDSTGLQYISTHEMITGSYKVKIEAVSNNKDYYFEESVFIP